MDTHFAPLNIARRYADLRLYSATLRKLKLLAALERQSMIAFLDLLVTLEYERRQLPPLDDPAPPPPPATGATPSA